MNEIDKANATSFESLGLKTADKPLRQQHLGQEDFMKLMTTQLNHQDPFKPMENGEFLTQMAQFSAVTGLKDIKDEFKDLSAALQSSQALQASSMVGRRVLVPGNETELPEQGPLKGAVELPASTSNLSIKITDARGELVKTLDLGRQATGREYPGGGCRRECLARPAGAAHDPQSRPCRQHQHEQHQADPVTGFRTEGETPCHFVPPFPASTQCRQ